MTPRLTLMERLRIGQEALAAAAGSKPKTTVAREVAREVIAHVPPIEKGPLHTCGCHMVLCATCRGWICRAPGHALHVCRGAEFSQVAESAPDAGGKGGGQ